MAVMVTLFEEQRSAGFREISVDSGADPVLPEPIAAPELERKQYGVHIAASEKLKNAPKMANIGLPEGDRLGLLLIHQVITGAIFKNRRLRIASEHNAAAALRTREIRKGLFSSEATVQSVELISLG